MAAVAAINDAGLWLPGATSKEDKIEKWWEVNRKHDPPLSRGATPLVERSMRVHGWSEAFAKRCLKGYRQFMELKSVMNDWQETKLAPPLAILQMWEQHILDNLNYTDDCFLLFGRVIGHDPDAMVNERITMDRIKTTQIAFQARYGNDLDPEVWEYGAFEGDGLAIDAEDQLRHHAPSTPRGRLPVAGIDRAVGGVSPSPRPTGRADRSLVADSQDEDLAPTRSRSPTRRPAPVAAAKPSSAPKSPKSPTGNEPITIFLRDSNSGEETYFSLRYRSTLRIVFTVYAERKGLNQDTLKFNFQGQSLTGYETPYSLGLEDRARIDVQVVAAGASPARRS
ncbi:hypothetical protein MPSEU_000769700 [Mayamaea pseudoterrestris]|nr:hypothetical protein MPSEU_000769700 [Mayamaea pseudoterrestris]